jgi:hypothetical protein
MTGQLWAQIGVFAILLWLLAFVSNLRTNAGVVAAALAACIMTPIALVVLAVLGGLLFGLFWLISVAVG